MIFRTLGWLAGTIALILLLTVTGCKDSPTAPSGPNFTGGWITQTIDGQDVTSLGMSAQFTQNQVSLTGADGCQTVSSFVTSGNRIITTILQDPCSGEPVGQKDTVTYTLSGDNLTINNGSQLIVMKRGTVVPKATLIGNWKAETFDGAPPANGNTVTLAIDGSTLRETTHTPAGESCDLVMNYTREEQNLNVQLVENSCTGEGVGGTDVIAFSINGQILTLKFSDGTTMVAKKI